MCAHADPRKRLEHSPQSKKLLGQIHLRLRSDKEFQDEKTDKIINFCLNLGKQC